MRAIILIGFLVIYGIVLWACIEDWRTKEVHTVLCIGFVSGNLLLSVAVCSSFNQILTGVIPGLYLLLCNLILPEKVGGADIYFMIGIGLLLGPGKALLLLMSSLLIISLYGFLCLLSGKAHKENTIAMIPLLSLFYIWESARLLKEGLSIIS